MNILLPILRIFGWRALLGYAWRLAKPQLEKLAKKSSTDFDDDVVKVADEMISKFLSAPGA